MEIEFEAHFTPTPRSACSIDMPDRTLPCSSLVEGMYC